MDCDKAAKKEEYCICVFNPLLDYWDLTYAAAVGVGVFIVVVVVFFSLLLFIVTHTHTHVVFKYNNLSISDYENIFAVHVHTIPYN